ncbi:Imm49 family immunity protein [Chitinibacter tainanensis]|uniref:Imm49 family immunity protein n=1 Tax=Chitinibacter tainanensis TaxID=230667 RepID=UPI00048C9D9E|nr:Imm49 family immunity protein [Chitinibacter tainanensis]
MSFEEKKSAAILDLEFSFESLCSDESLLRKLKIIGGCQGNVVACMQGVSSIAENKALYSFYAERDLVAFRQWMYVAAKIDLHILPHRSEGYWFYRYWLPLMSNNRSLIEHVAWYPERYPEGTDLDFSILYQDQIKPRHRQHQRWVYQLALRGDWNQLLIECEKALTDPPKSTKKYELCDYRYLQALVHKDIKTMEECLAELLMPRVRKARNDLAILEDLLSVDALVLSKLAWLHGIEIDPQSDYVPREWLPMTPNLSYADPYDFMNDIQLP